MKKKSLVKQFRSDSPDTYLSHVDQQTAMLLDTIDDAKPKKIKKIDFSVPEIDDSINRIAESPNTNFVEHFNVSGIQAVFKGAMELCLE